MRFFPEPSIQELGRRQTNAALLTIFNFMADTLFLHYLQAPVLGMDIFRQPVG